MMGRIGPSFFVVMIVFMAFMSVINMSDKITRVCAQMKILNGTPTSIHVGMRTNSFTVPIDENGMVFATIMKSFKVPRGLMVNVDNGMAVLEYITICPTKTQCYECASGIHHCAYTPCNAVKHIPSPVMCHEVASDSCLLPLETEDSL